MNNVIFEKAYYDRLIKEFGYNPIGFEQISFSLGDLTASDLQKFWLCHMNGNIFSEAKKCGENIIATTGFGMSGVPHIGTLGQILRMIRLQKNGIPVQIVLGDLDAYNGKNMELQYVQTLSSSYKKFIIDLGFNVDHPNILRSQDCSLSTLRLAYLLGRYMDDQMFVDAEEDLHNIYAKNGKVDDLMSYRRKLSLNLMTADFLELLCHNNYNNVLVVLGIDEHKYVNFAKKVIEKASREHADWFMNKHYSAMYSGMLKGLYGFPKMSKSFPDSGIRVDMSAETIREKITNGETVTSFPETNVIYQMIAWASLYDKEQIEEAYIECKKQSSLWKKIKNEYIIHLSGLCKRWCEI